MFAIITETWFFAGNKLDRLTEQLEDDMGLKIINKLRQKTGQSNPGGGVSVVFDPKKIKLTEYKCRRNGHEIVDSR